MEPNRTQGRTQDKERERKGSKNEKERGENKIEKRLLERKEGDEK